MLQQQFLFSPEELFKEPLKKYELFFSLLDLSSLESPTSTGRKPVSRAALTRALIFKNLRSLPTLSDLVVELYERPALACTLGFQPKTNILPVERFSAFLRDADNILFQNIRESLVKKLISSKIIKGRYLSFDACPIKANVKHNNPKTNVKERFSKEHPPKNDPDCRLGAFATFRSGTKKVEFFWGYRNHVTNDTESELPLVEKTLPANVRGSSIALSQLQFVKEQLPVKVKAVMGDSEYDAASLIEFIVKELGAKPRIAKNVRRGESPITGSKKFAKEHPYCPWFHPQFTRGNGCYKNIRVDVDESIRQNIDYDSESFKKDYNRRTSSERIFSRLLSLLMQEPTVKGLQATANFCTIAHITVLAVAYFASFVNEPKRIRFVKTFIPYL